MPFITKTQKCVFFSVVQIMSLVCSVPSIGEQKTQHMVHFPLFPLPRKASKHGIKTKAAVLLSLDESSA